MTETKRCCLSFQTNLWKRRAFQEIYAPLAFNDQTSVFAMETIHTVKSAAHGNYWSLKQKDVFIVCVRVLGMYVHCMRVPGSCRGQKRELGPLEWKLQIVVAHHKGAGSTSVFSARGVSVLSHGAISPGPALGFYVVWSTPAWTCLLQSGC